jgi:hypothetical protein
MSETRHQFCRRHSSWFCPCVSPWLYGAAAKAAYENNEQGSAIAPPPYRRDRADDGDEKEQLDLIEATLRGAA